MSTYFGAVMLVTISLITLGSTSVQAQTHMRSFKSDAEVMTFFKRIAKAQEQREQSVPVPMMDVPPPPPSPAAASDAAVVVTSSRVANPTITNNQTANVDEGGIVKTHGSHLVVLRRGRLFTLDTAGGRLAPIDTVDAFPPADRGGSEAWYDEMLVSGDMVVVIGFNYARAGTEVNRFNIDANGKLTYRDTHNLRSNDYYSSRNYASRLIGNRLVVYAPLDFYSPDFESREGQAEWLDQLPALRRWTKGGASAGYERLLLARNLYVPELLRRRFGSANLSTLHSVTNCDLSKPQLDCTAVAVLGSESRNFYVSQSAVYVWTGDLFSWDERNGDNDAMLYKLPLNGAAPQAVGAWGGPVDQFSFREEADGSLNVVTVSEGDGERMWRAEVKSGDMALLHLPKRSFGDGSQFAPTRYYRPLAHSGDQWDIENRYVGRHLLYTNRVAGQDALSIVALDGARSWNLPLEHAITRIDQMSGDGVVIGTNKEGALGFSAVALSKSADPVIANTYFLPSAQEGENRSHAFFYRPDPASADGTSGILGLPVAKRLAPQQARFLGSGSAIVYLSRTQRRLSLVGELEAKPPPSRIDDNCKASCVDWYGNARPIFLGDRTFALMGYELVEGRRNKAGLIEEIRRVDFTPRVIAAEVGEKK